MNKHYSFRIKTSDFIYKLNLIVTRKSASKSLDEFSKELAKLIMENSDSVEDALDTIQQMSLALSLLISGKSFFDTTNL